MFGAVQKLVPYLIRAGCSDARRAVKLNYSYAVNWNSLVELSILSWTKTESRDVYGHTLSGAICSATQQVSVRVTFRLFQQPHIKVNL